MSVESIAVVLHHSQADGATKLVLVGIANHDGDGGAWPSMKTLAKYAHVDPRSIQRAIKRLVALGELEVEVNGGGDRRTPEHERPNRYTIRVRCPDWCDGTTRHEPRDAVDNPRLPPDTGVTPPPDTSVTTPLTPEARPPDTSVTPPLTPASPEPPANHPEPARTASERARESDPVDNSVGVAALRAAFADRPALSMVGGWSKLNRSDRDFISDLVFMHGIDRLVAAVADTRNPPRSVRAFFARWNDLPMVPSTPPRDDGPTCEVCGHPVAACDAKTTASPDWCDGPEQRRSRGAA